MPETPPVRVRFAPSPTGFLHLGGARTALFNWLWARKNNGTFILRVEDTDTERSTKESTDQVLESMKWLGFDWDEGPFFQSERLEIYQQKLDQLWQEKKIYPAFESREELDKAREEAIAKKETPIYDRAALKLTDEEVKSKMEAGEPFVWRLKTPDDDYTDVPETLLGGEGKTRFLNKEIDDFILTRPGTLDKPGMPLYNFVCVVDDVLMEITHVIRGADHLTNSAKQVLIYEALGAEPPLFTHIPLIMKNKKKMSKRDEDADPMFPVSVSARRDVGYLKEAMVNYLALLGWSFPDDQEIFTADELIDNFTLSRLQKSNANFDEDKFLHINSVYIKQLSADDLYEKVLPFWEKAEYEIAGTEKEKLFKILLLVQERCRLLSDFPSATKFFFEAPETYDAKGAKKAFKGDDTIEIINMIIECFEKVEVFTIENVEAAMRQLSEEKEIGFGKIAMPVRISVTGTMASPGLPEVLELLGREETVKRLRTVVSHLEKGDIPVNE